MIPPDGALARIAAAALVLGACGRDPPDPPSANAASSAVTVASAAPAASAEKRPPPKELDVEADPVRRELLHAPLASVSLVGWHRPGLFRVTIERQNPPGPAPALLQLALTENPIAYRRSLAFERLARALGMRVVPAAVFRRIGTGELGALFAGQRDLRDYLALHAAVQNDGTVDALMFAAGRGDGPGAWALPAGHDVTLDHSLEAETWARWAASPDPHPGENSSLLADYIETLVLDYLAGHVLRRSVHFDDVAQAILLTDNAAAFPSKVDPRALDVLLSRLRPVTRFPRGLQKALLALDRDHARDLLASGPFETWLVSPRTLVDLDERRKSLLTLISARVAERGEVAVLAL
ncbi:hypothetical protein [Polyangium jinanense]|uniref:Uncharacterized protein n=1 Tax=Polyangium jinanense TaxID=2829994 RepID=A0A9X3X3U9_9BACT|nr:hypothetical protein [Polyangium jinanense]MDC3980866.1 hypothetical protein [Polyangium jinanense]